jgi:hypothetical protein
MSDILTKMLKDHTLIRETTQESDCHDNNRKLDRFPIGNGIYALLSWKKLGNQFLLGHLIDINKEGCAFYYVSSRSNTETFRLQKNCKLKIFTGFKAIELKENTVVYDHELAQYSTAQISVRRCGIKFAPVMIF